MRVPEYPVSQAHAVGSFSDPDGLLAFSGQSIIIHESFGFSVLDGTYVKPGAHSSELIRL